MHAPSVEARQLAGSDDATDYAEMLRRLFRLDLDEVAPPALSTQEHCDTRAALAVTSKLLNKQGQKMVDLPVTAPTEAGQGYLIDLPLASLAQGEYLLEISAAAEAQKPATELIAFRVGG